MTEKDNLTMLAPASRTLSEHVADQVRKAIVTDSWMHCASGMSSSRRMNCKSTWQQPWMG